MSEEESPIDLLEKRKEAEARRNIQNAERARKLRILRIMSADGADVTGYGTNIDVEKLPDSVIDGAVARWEAVRMRDGAVESIIIKTGDTERKMRPGDEIVGLDYDGGRVEGCVVFNIFPDKSITYAKLDDAGGVVIHSALPFDKLVEIQK